MKIFDHIRAILFHEYFVFKLSINISNKSYSNCFITFIDARRIQCSSMQFIWIEYQNLAFK